MEIKEKDIVDEKLIKRKKKKKPTNTKSKDKNQEIGGDSEAKTKKNKPKKRRKKEEKPVLLQSELAKLEMDDERLHEIEEEAVEAKESRRPG